MDTTSLAAKLEATGFPVRKIVRMGDNAGWRFMLTNGAVIHCFDDGRYVVHGPGAASIRFILRSAAFCRPACPNIQDQPGFYAH